MIPLLLLVSITTFVIGFWGMVTFKKPLHRLMMMGVWGSSFYTAFFAILESI